MAFRLWLQQIKFVKIEYVLIFYYFGAYLMIFIYEYNASVLYNKWNRTRLLELWEISKNSAIDLQNVTAINISCLLLNYVLPKTSCKHIIPASMYCIPWPAIHYIYLNVSRFNKRLRIYNLQFKTIPIHWDMRLCQNSRGSNLSLPHLTLNS